MNDLVAAAFELVENFGQREDSAGVNVVQLSLPQTQKRLTAPANRLILAPDQGRPYISV